MTKAGVLERLKQELTVGHVMPLCVIDVDDWEKSASQAHIRAIQESFDSTHLAVRSSFVGEDSQMESKAGMFTSCLDVDRNNGQELLSAIETVRNSAIEHQATGQILIQPMLSQISMAGVLFTCDTDTLAPYLVVNYDESGRTDSVTAGYGSGLRTYVHYKRAPYRGKDPRIGALFEVALECERILACDGLDIEFGITERNEVYIFQARPIVRGLKKDLSQVDLGIAIERIEKKVRKLSQIHPNLLGGRTFYGVMPDWNPAEMIGIRAKQLAFSLYRNLITDSVWSNQRSRYGYRDLKSHPLMVSFMGAPYIDIRVSFNSFIPASLDESIASKLVEYYLDKLKENPSHHDKVEFEIVVSCARFDWVTVRDDLLANGFLESEIEDVRRSVWAVTRDIFNPESSEFLKDIECAQKLGGEISKIQNSSLWSVDRIYWYGEYCRQYGTLPFAGVARTAFMATQMLQSMVKVGALTDQEYASFFESLGTVSKRLSMDLCRFRRGEFTRTEFIERYGHLRPGTYDIESKTYRESFDEYFGFAENIDPPHQGAFVLPDQKIAMIDRLLKNSGIQIDARSFFDFAKRAIEERENTKFAFSKAVSLILDEIETLGKGLGLEPKDLAHLDYGVVTGVYTRLEHEKIVDLFKENIKRNKSAHTVAQAIRLPALITQPNDVEGFYEGADEPNFVTLKRVQGDVTVHQNNESQSMHQRIVFIESADPGFEFVFTHGIQGLVTAFGGANSHMAVRCAELGIPAVIGAGERRFSEWSKFQRIEIDCLNRNVRTIT